jgi:hypothetical protein
LAKPIVRPFVIDGRITGPDPLDDIQIFRRSLIALSVIEEIAVALLVRIVAAADDVDQESQRHPFGDPAKRNQMRLDHMGLPKLRVGDVSWGLETPRSSIA